MTLPSDVLVQQYRGRDLAVLVDAVGEVIDRRLRDAVDSVGDSLTISIDGIWLDHLGERLGLPRPLVDTSVSWGFDDAGVGFDQASFGSAATRYASRIGVGDDLYRRLLQARAVYILHGADGETVDSILRILYDDGRVEDDGSLDVTLHIPRVFNDVLHSAVQAVQDEIIPRSAGVSYTMVADL